jgi:phage terminase large subunit-like protein
VHDYRAELMAFPAAGNDDQVDCQSQALLHLSERSRATMPALAGAPNRVTRFGPAFPGR